MDLVGAELLAEYPAGLGDLAPHAMWPADRFRMQQGTVTAMDRALTGTASRATGLPADARLLAASPDLRLVVAAVSDGLVVLGESEWRLPVPGGDSATILGSGELLVTARVIPPGHEFATANRVLLLDPAAREIADEVFLALDEAFMTATAHPRDGSVLLDAGMGQDGSEVFAVSVASRKLRVKHVLSNVVPGGFDPAGDRLLLLPHPNLGPDEAAVLAWPSLERVAELVPGRLGLAPGEGFYFYGCFLGKDEVLLTTVGDTGLAVVICSGDLFPRARVSLPGYGPGTGWEVVAVSGIDRGTFVARLEREGYAALTTLWRLPG